MEGTLVQQLGLDPVAMQPIGELLVNLLIGVGLSLLLAWHYVRFGRTYSNRHELAQVFPLVILSTVLIISLVQTNIALSLGLVGALSIVRFRTPIKEPEELSYLFLAIAVGIGLGASQRLATLLAVGVILAVIAGRSLMLRQRDDRGLYLNVDLPVTEGDSAVFSRIDSLLAEHAQSSRVQRLDRRGGSLQATYAIDCASADGIVILMDRLSDTIPEADISFVEQRGLPGL